MSQEDGMVLSPRFEQALVYAAVAHAGQVRKGTKIPYISHPLIVAGLALEHGADEDEAIGALLHDVAEDCGGEPRLADIRGRFGDRVAAIVDGCTDTYVRPKPPAAERKAAHVQHLRDQQNGSVLLVSACDKLANARAILSDYRRIGEALWERFSVDRSVTLRYYRSLADLFLTRLPSPLSHEVERVVTAIETAAGSPTSELPK